MPKPARITAVSSATPEAEAFTALEQLVQGSSNETRNRFSNWFYDLHGRQRAGRPLTVLEHTALVFALRSGFLMGGMDEAMIPEVTQVLAKSWRQLANRMPSNPLERLPSSVLRRERHEIQIFHAAAFQNLPRNEAARETALIKDYLGNSRDLIFALAAITLIGFSPIGREALAGLALGYAIATMIEYGFHRGLSHPPRWVENFFKRRGGKLATAFRELRISHFGFHHGKTFRERYNVQFSNQAEKLSVYREALARGGVAADDLIQSEYGNSISPRGYRKGLATGLPFLTPTIVLTYLAARWAGLQPGGIFLAVSFFVSLLYLPATGVFHRYMHMTPGQAHETAHPWMRWFFKTRYTAMMSRLHYGHHRGRGGNYNLIFGADVLFGSIRQPTVRQLLEMKKLGLIY